ncbi:OmpA/MotB family protein [Paramicrobacterium agarici]|uniref:Chemotaxis protein MotB n=1 Tax=Paramicrobacterium agarici TaxID=630514 RepID=A0A2A9DV87_9MICO|nr:flagellar motor protein MotB [Microbacterium agarici]PFG30598.1 chemotaxis protein MotB [Microbacterium agarici]TQO23616.1 chemotaxis protein MotB [Microbacterium agarici]
MSVRQRRRVPRTDENHVDERWMASYLDMVTVLMCMFIVLFAMSTVDQKKFAALRESLATGFGQTVSDTTDVSEGLIVPEELMDEKGEGFVPDANTVRAETELQNLEDLRDRMVAALEAQGLRDTVSFTIDERGLTVRLVGGETFFTTNSAELSTMAVRVLDTLGTVIVDVPNQVSVEGHADYRKSVAPFPTNWELSSGRATEVLRHLVEDCQVPGARVKSVGYGATRPIAEGKSDSDLALNRRVDIVVLSDESEAVRDLMARLMEARPTS